MLYQQDMRLPIDAELMRNGVDSEGVDSEGEEDLDKVMDILLEKRKEVFEKVEKNIKRAQQYQKEKYDRKHLPRELDLGMEVLIENSAQKERKGGKLEDAFLGPYIVHESLGKGLYKVKNKSDVILKKKVNIARLKMYKERDDSKVKPLKAIFSFTPQPFDQQLNYPTSFLLSNLIMVLLSILFLKVTGICQLLVNRLVGNHSQQLR